MQRVRGSLCAYRDEGINIKTIAIQEKFRFANGRVDGEELALNVARNLSVQGVFDDE